MSVNIKELKILVVESVDMMGDLLETVLASIRTNTLFAARTSKHGMALFQAQQHDLIIVDLDIDPGGGITFAKNIRDYCENTGLNHVPIILMATYINDEAIQMAKDNGINDLLIKPFSFDDLTKHINFLLNPPENINNGAENNG